MIFSLNSEYNFRGRREDDLSGPYASWFEGQAMCKYNSHGQFVKVTGQFLGSLSLAAAR